MAVCVPEQGDLIIVSFNPQSGHEQKGRRPALVISRSLFNRRTGMAFVCPITNTSRRFPFHVPVRENGITGFVMVEQVKSIDYRSRNASIIGKASLDLLAEVQSLLYACIY